jgi:hypothetical protein
MDNGLIFPYPCVGARDESTPLTTQKVADQSPSGGRGPLAAWDPGW